MDVSHISALLVTHSRFSDVYSLFEETMELLPKSVVDEFMCDVTAIRTKLDSWKTLFTYEKEKKTFLVEKYAVRSGSETLSMRDSKDAASHNGSSTNDSSCTSPRHRPPSEHRRSASMNNASHLEETLPLVLESDNDETWLCDVPVPVLATVSTPTPTPPPDPIKSVVENDEDEKKKKKTQTQKKSEFRDSLNKSVDSVPQRAAKKASPSPAKPLTSKVRPALKTRIPRPPLSPHRSSSRGSGVESPYRSKSRCQDVDRGTRPYQR